MALKSATMTSTHTSSIHSWYTTNELELRSSVKETDMEAPSEVIDVGDINSTPTRPRVTSHLYTHQSVDPSLREELKRPRYRGISFEEFLKCSFGLSDKDMEALKESVREKSVHESEEYKSQATEFAMHAENLETKMYKPFAEMGNMVLNKHQEGSTKRIKVLPSTGNEFVKGDRFGKRKPDVSLVPEKDGDKSIDMNSLRWYHVLCVLEFKKAHNQIENILEKRILQTVNPASAARQPRR